MQKRRNGEIFRINQISSQINNIIDQNNNIIDKINNIIGQNNNIIDQINNIIDQIKVSWGYRCQLDTAIFAWTGGSLDKRGLHS